MQAISESDSFTTCSKRDVADLVESRSEKFQENEKKKDEKISKAPLSLHSSSPLLDLSLIPSMVWIWL